MSIVIRTSEEKRPDIEKLLEDLKRIYNLRWGVNILSGVATRDLAVPAYGQYFQVKAGDYLILPKDEKEGNIAEGMAIGLKREGMEVYLIDKLHQQFKRI